MKKPWILMLVFMVTVFSGQFCLGQTQSAKPVKMRSHNAQVIMEKRAHKITQQQREEAAKKGQGAQKNAPNPQLKPVIENDRPIQERGRP